MYIMAKKKEMTHDYIGEKFPKKRYKKGLRYKIFKDSTKNVFWVEILIALFIVIMVVVLFFNQY